MHRRPLCLASFLDVRSWLVPELFEGILVHAFILPKSKGRSRRNAFLLHRQVNAVEVHGLDTQRTIRK